MTQEIQSTLYLQVMLHIKMENHSLQVWTGLGKIISHQVQQKPEYSSINLLQLIKMVQVQKIKIQVQMEQLH